MTDDGKLQPMPVEVDDRILFGRYSGNEVKPDKEEYLVLPERAVLDIL